MSNPTPGCNLPPHSPQSLIPQSSRDGGGATVAHLLKLRQAVVRLSSSVLMHSPSSSSASKLLLACCSMAVDVRLS
jgi:hypothetical protein